MTRPLVEITVPLQKPSAFCREHRYDQAMDGVCPCEVCWTRQSNKVAREMQERREREDRKDARSAARRAFWVSMRWPLVAWAGAAAVWAMEVIVVCLWGQP